MQTEFGRSVREYMDLISHKAAEQVESDQHQAAAGMNQPGEGIVNPLTGMMSVWEQAFREASRFATQNMQPRVASWKQLQKFARDAASRTTEHMVEKVDHPHAHKRAAASKKNKKMSSVSRMG